MASVGLLILGSRDDLQGNLSLSFFEMNCMSHGKGDILDKSTKTSANITASTLEYAVRKKNCLTQAFSTKMKCLHFLTSCVNTLSIKSNVKGLLVFLFTRMLLSF